MRLRVHAPVPELAGYRNLFLDPSKSPIPVVQFLGSLDPLRLDPPRAIVLQVPAGRQAHMQPAAALVLEHLEGNAAGHERLAGELTGETGGVLQVLPTRRDLRVALAPEILRAIDRHRLIVRDAFLAVVQPHPLAVR